MLIPSAPWLAKSSGANQRLHCQFLRSGQAARWWLCLRTLPTLCMAPRGRVCGLGSGSRSEGACVCTVVAVVGQAVRGRGRRGRPQLLPQGHEVPEVRGDVRASVCVCVSPSTIPQNFIRQLFELSPCLTMLRNFATQMFTVVILAQSAPVGWVSGKLRNTWVFTPPPHPFPHWSAANGCVLSVRCGASR